MATATATASKTTVGVFETRAAAEKAVAELRSAGYRDDQIGMVAKDASGNTVKTDGAGETHAGDGLAIGAAAGAATGAAVGLGILAGVIPVVGPAIMAGTLGTILSNALGGAAIAGLAGALVGWGIPEDEAKFYEGEVQAGRFLVTVENGTRNDARGVFTKNGGYDHSTARATTGADASRTSSAYSASGAGQTVQLKEEQMRVNKDSTKVGDVQVRKEVHTEHKQITVPVEREEVVIERRAVSGAAASGDITAQEIRIPVKEERVHVSKETVVKEEVSVGKRKVQDTQTVTGDVRKEELVVETEGQAKVRQSNTSDRK